MNIEELLPDGQWMSENEYVVRCPWLDHPTHNHCYINVAKGVFFCHFGECGEKGSIKRLLKKYEIVGELEPRVTVEKKEQELVDFSQFPRVMSKEGTLGMLAFSYLTGSLENGGRGLTVTELEEYDIRFSDSGKYYGRVLIPIYENNKMVNFVARSFMSCIKPKYLYPRTGETLLTCGEAIFGYEEALEDVSIITIIITEGAFDAIAINRLRAARGLAILSSHLTKSQLKKLLGLSKSFVFIIVLDSDAHKDASHIAETLSAHKRKTMLVLLERGDPASIPIEDMKRAIEEAEKYSFEKKLEIVTPKYKRI